MKVLRRLNNVDIEAEGDNSRDIFGDLAKLQEVFQHSKCGCCDGTEYRYVVRKAKDAKGKEFDYYELHCQDPKCRARIPFGQSENGVLYPKRRWGQLSEKDQEQRQDAKPAPDAKFDYLPNNGWYKYTGPKS